jgi:MerR family copper efflux transcriptional regulator
MNRTGLMTVGALSRRGGIPVKALRAYSDKGLVYPAGRSRRATGSLTSPPCGASR